MEETVVRSIRVLSILLQGEYSYAVYNINAYLIKNIKTWFSYWFHFIFSSPQGPDAEDKVLGSILLPSYKISPVDKNDNTGSRSKPYAFKAEHQNMRTYYFAAETKEAMLQWMNAMSLASILQHQPRYVSISILNQKYQNLNIDNLNIIYVSSV